MRLWLFEACPGYERVASFEPDPCTSTTPVAAELGGARLGRRVAT